MTTANTMADGAPRATAAATSFRREACGAEGLSNPLLKDAASRMGAQTFLVYPEGPPVVRGAQPFQAVWVPGEKKALIGTASGIPVWIRAQSAEEALSLFFEDELNHGP